MEVLSNIGFDWQVALANFVSFLIIFYILKKSVFGPVGTILEERKEKIAIGLAKAKESEDRSKLVEQEARDILMEARTKANHVVADAQTKADVIADEASGRAEHEASQIITDARSRIAHEEQLAWQKLGEQASQLVVLGVSKVLGKKVDKDEDLELAKQTLVELKDHQASQQDN